MPTLHGCLPTSFQVRSDPVVTKIDTPEFKNIFTKELNILVGLFAKYNYELRIAGGAVRDLLMNRKPKDIDLATTATPHEMKSMFRKEGLRMLNTGGEKYGTITLRINKKENFEVSTLRGPRDPVNIQFTKSWYQDAGRRDLTINSMFLDFDGTVYDFFYGYEDLRACRVVFVENAEERIKEDILRILRYFRFYGRFAATPIEHDEQVLTVIRRNAQKLTQVSGERIWSELRQILVGNFAKELILTMHSCDILKYIGVSGDINDQEFRDIFARVEKFPPPHHPILFLTALLWTTDQAIELDKRLKFSKFERELMKFILEYRDLIGKGLNELKDYHVMCTQPTIHQCYVLELLKYSGQLEVFNSLRNWEMPPFPVHGNMLQERNCPPGKETGEVMMQLKNIWAQDNFGTSVSELLDIYLPKVLAKVVPAPTGSEHAKK